MAVSPLPAVDVDVVLNPVTQTSEPIVVVIPDALSQMIKNSSCAHANYYSLALVTPPALSLISHAKTSQPQQQQQQPRTTTTTTTLKPTTAPDRPQAYKHAPQRAAAASCRHHQRRASRTYNFLGCSVLPHSHRHQTCRPGARRQWPGENLAVGYAQGRARYWTAMRRQCPESDCVRGHFEAPVMR